jgi:hypothetical protein
MATGGSSEKVNIKLKERTTVPSFFKDKTFCKNIALLLQKGQF